MQALDRYTGLLADEAQRDLAVMHNPWVVLPVVPFLFYLLYACAKWYVLLMHVTMPMTLWLAGKHAVRKPESTYKQN